MQKPPSADATAETRARLLSTASSIFADIGYQAATTRQICIDARANVAAVNYHFGDKLGLYTEVLKSVIASEHATLAGHNLLAMPADVALREFVALMFQNFTGSCTPDRYTRLMAHELLQPTPGLAVVVEHIIRPRALLLCAIVARLLGCPVKAARTRLCAHSIIGQILHYLHGRPVIEILWPDWSMTPAAREEIVDHVTRFSLAALSVAQRGTATKKAGDAGTGKRRSSGASHAKRKHD